MKKKIDHILHQMDSYPLPDKEKMLANIPNVPADEEKRHTRRRFGFPKVAVLAMSALLVVGGGFGVAMDVRAYNEAIDFFEQYNMSAEGFTRSEVKKIYKDIITESFTYEKTEEALASGLEGYEIQAQPLDSEGLKRLWMEAYVWGNSFQQEDGEEGVEYSYCMSGNVDDPHGYATLTKSKNGKRVWQVLLGNDVVIHEVCPVGNKVLVAGEVYSTDMVRVYFLDSNGSVIWKKEYNLEITDLKIQYILCQNDNYVLFCDDYGPGADLLRILTIDKDGNVVGCRDTEFNSTLGDITQIAPFGNGYLILKGTDQVLIEKDGEITDSLSFGTETEGYEFTDMEILDGMVYLSGRSVTKVGNISKGWSGLFELYREQFRQQESVSVEEKTEFVKEHNSAVLVICDPDSGNMEMFYTISGASGGALEVSNNRLIWNVNRYTSVNLFVNMNSHYSGGGSQITVEADVWQYAFTLNGQIVGEKDTGNSVKIQG